MWSENVRGQTHFSVVLPVEGPGLIHDWDVQRKKEYQRLERDIDLCLPILQSPNSGFSCLLSLVPNIYEFDNSHISLRLKFWLQFSIHTNMRQKSKSSWTGIKDKFGGRLLGKWLQCHFGHQVQQQGAWVQVQLHCSFQFPASAQPGRHRAMAQGEVLPQGLVILATWVLH